MISKCENERTDINQLYGSMEGNAVAGRNVHPTLIGVPACPDIEMGGGRTRRPG